MRRNAAGQEFAPPFPGSATALTLRRAWRARGAVIKERGGQGRGGDLGCSADHGDPAAIWRSDRRSLRSCLVICRRRPGLRRRCSLRYRNLRIGEHPRKVLRSVLLKSPKLCRSRCRARAAEAVKTARPSLTGSGNRGRECAAGSAQGRSGSHALQDRNLCAAPASPGNSFTDALELCGAPARPR